MMMMMRMMIRRVREVGRSSYSTGQSGVRGLSTLPSVGDAVGFWNSCARGCRVVLTGSAGFVGYKSGDYLTPIDTTDLREEVKETKEELESLEYALEVAQTIDVQGHDGSSGEGLEKSS